MANFKAERQEEERLKREERPDVLLKQAVDGLIDSLTLSIINVAAAKWQLRKTSLTRSRV